MGGVRSTAMDLLENLRSSASSIPEVRLAVLFGSVARGEARRKSDVDLGVSVEPDTSAVRYKVESELERAAGRSVHMIFLGDAPPLLRFEISRDGVLLFQRQDDLWRRFKERALIDWWDWAPSERIITAAAVRRLREKVAHGQS
jgi:predicted nucleotidyltransferase